MNSIDDYRHCIFDLPEEEKDISKFLINDSQHVGAKLVTDTRVPGRLSNPEFYDFWKNELQASEFVLDTIRNGYKFPFVSEPPPGICRNNKSMLKNKEFAYKELLRLESLGCISRVEEQPYLCLPLSVVYSKKLRLVVDGSRHLNPYLEDRKIKLEGLDVGEQLLQQNDFQCKADLDSGYWHLKLFDGHKKYVGVHFECEDGTKLFWVWNTLFLGIKDAVFIFTKILIPHKQYLRNRGIRMMLYIDDQRVIASNYIKCFNDNKFANETLEKAGWILNVKKSKNEPVQNMEFLGLMNDSRSMKYFVPEEKKKTICDLIKDVLNPKKVHIKVLAKLCGKLQFCFKAMGPTVKLLSRSSYYLIAKADSWNSMIVLNDMARVELNYLLSNFDELNGFPLRAEKTQQVVDITLASDASDVGNCVYEVVDDNNDILHKRVFSYEESRKSSTHREILAFYDFYTSHKAEKYRNCNILHYTDNMNCETILTVGSRNFSLHFYVLKIFLAWRELNLKVSVQYVSRNSEIIQFADTETKNFDLHDYSLDEASFEYVSRNFGPFHLDCFATKENKKCNLYISRFIDEEAYGWNFFAQKLPHCNLFVFPPVHLITAALLHLEKNKAFGSLIVPKWISSHFWTSLCKDGVHFNECFTKVLVFSPKYVASEFVRNDMFRGVKKFDTLVLKFDFSFKEISSLRVRCSLNGCKRCLF